MLVIIGWTTQHCAHTHATFQLLKMSHNNWKVFAKERFRCFWRLLTYEPMVIKELNTSKYQHFSVTSTLMRWSSLINIWEHICFLQENKVKWILGLNNIKPYFIPKIRLVLKWPENSTWIFLINYITYLVSKSFVKSMKSYVTKNSFQNNFFRITFYWIFVSP